MKKSIFVIVALLLGVRINAQTSIITHVLEGSKCTHESVYMPSGEVLTIEGLKSKSYPIKLKPTETYVISEPINISCFNDMGINYRYYVAKNNNHTMTIDLLNMNDEIFATYELTGTINTSTKTIGGYFSDLNFEEPIVKVKFRLTGAYSATEYANINEFQIYGTKIDWNSRSVYLLDPEVAKSDVILRWISVDDAIKYDVVYNDDLTTNTISMTPNDSLIQTIELTDLSLDCDYTYQIVAYNESGEKITSTKSVFETTGIEKTQKKANDYSIKVEDGLIVITCEKISNFLVYNINGVAIVDNKKLTTGENQINLANGMYLIKIDNDNGRVIVVK